MRKALFVLVLTLALVFSLAAIGEEVPTFTSGSYRYILQADGSAVITMYRGSEHELTIPAELDGHPVTGIGEDAFYASHGLTSVTIPDGVGDVIRNPWTGCTDLTAFRVSAGHPTLAVIDGVLYSKPDKRLVCWPGARTAENFEIPRGIQVIGDAAFFDCTGLTGVTIPDSVTSIGVGAFSGCTGLRSIAIPGSVTVISDRMLSGCTALTDVVIPASVTAIGARAFTGCEGLTDIVIPDGVTVIGNSAFSECRGLTAIAVPGSAVSISESAFSGCTGLTEAVLSDGVAAVGVGAFFRCRRLTSVTLPDSVTSIADSAFAYCLSLTSVTIPGSVTFIGAEAFAKCPSLSLNVSRDSYAEQYCIDNKLPYQIDDLLDWLTNTPATEPPAAPEDFLDWFNW